MADGSVVIEMDQQPASPVDSNQVIIDVPDSIQLQPSVNGSISPSLMPSPVATLPSPAGTLPPEGAPVVIDQVPDSTPGDNVQVAVKMPSDSADKTPRPARALNAAAEVCLNDCHITEHD